MFSFSQKNRSCAIRRKPGFSSEDSRGSCVVVDGGALPILKGEPYLVRAISTVLKGQQSVVGVVVSAP